MKVENLENAMDEMFDFITDLPSGLDGFESDFKEAFDELEKVKSDNVVEIVRCNDCKYLKDFECKFLKSRIGGKDFFCGIGTREEG